MLPVPFNRHLTGSTLFHRSPQSGNCGEPRNTLLDSQSNSCIFYLTSTAQQTIYLYSTCITQLTAWLKVTASKDSCSVLPIPPLSTAITQKYPEQRSSSTAREGFGAQDEIKSELEFQIKSYLFHIHNILAKLKGRGSEKNALGTTICIKSLTFI